MGVEQMPRLPLLGRRQVRADAIQQFRATLGVRAADAGLERVDDLGRATLQQDVDRSCTFEEAVAGGHPIHGDCRVPALCGKCDDMVKREERGVSGHVTRLPDGLVVAAALRPVGWRDARGAASDGELYHRMV